MMRGDGTFNLLRGTRPLLVSLPHVGTHIPDDQRHRYAAHAFDVDDTDWFLDRIYAFAGELGASLIVPHYSRYLIDLNRPPDNTPMYPGANNTSLCSTRSFGGETLYRDGQAPDEAEISRRRHVYWQPYHDALAEELQRLRTIHGHVILFDGHSIRSQLPWLFDGTLPDLNLGTAGGASCVAGLRDALVRVLESQTRFTRAVDGRFKGGYITRRYGRPQAGCNAVQLEICWSTYMDEKPPYAVAPARANELDPILRGLIHAMLSWRSDAG